MFSRFTQVGTCISTSFLSMGKNYFSVYIYRIFLYVLSCWTFGCIYLLATMNDAAINICMQVLVWLYISISLGFISRSRIAESYTNSVFNCLRTARLFPKAAAPFYSPILQQSMRAPIFPYSHQCFFDFDYSYPGTCEMVSHCGFDLRSFAC